MTPSELAKVRELVEAQRDAERLYDTVDILAEENGAQWDLYQTARERYTRALIAVEAMVAEHQTKEPKS